jgi:archaellin
MTIKKNNIPYIYKNPSEINVINMIKKVFLKYRSIEKTTKYLNKKNFKYRNNKNWNEIQIKNCLKKFFPNLLVDKNSDLVDNYFSKYQELNNDIIDVDEKLNMKNINIKLENTVIDNIRRKRKYIKK